MSLPREVASHPTSGEPILAGIGRYGSYVQHGKTYANLGRDDDVLEIGGNRAIDLIVAKESGAGGRVSARARGASSASIRAGGAVSVKQGRFGAYVNHGKINATLPKGTDLASLTLDEALAALAAKAAGGGGMGGCSASIPTAARSPCATDASAPMSIGAGSTRPSQSDPRPTRSPCQALELIAEREGKPAARPRKAAKAANEGQGSAGETAGQRQARPKREGPSETGHSTARVRGADVDRGRWVV